MDYEKFFDYVRQHIGLTDSNVDGFQKIIEYGRNRGTQVNKLAYIIATAYWETGRTVQPVKEAYWKDESWRRRNLRYYPWYGRGLVQTTWESNYLRIGQEIGVGRLFLDDPNKLLEWPFSLAALFVGMEKGIYTGKDLQDYIDDLDEDDREDRREYKNARRIVNGEDRDDIIAGLALVFERGLKAGGYKKKEVPQKEGDIMAEMKDWKVGDRGPHIKWLQEQLGGLKVDGDFGPKTEAALMAFQDEIMPSGVANSLVKAALDCKKKS